MFEQIRVVIIIIVIVATIAAVVITTIKKKRILSILLCVCCPILCFVIDVVPFENLFFRFDSVDQSFYYSYDKRYLITNVFEEENCAIVFYSFNRNFDYTVLRKDSRGWKVTSSTIFYQKIKKLSDFHHVFLTQMKVDSQKYLTIVRESYRDIADRELESVTDSNNTFFNKFVNKDIYQDVLYCAITKNTDNYKVIINGTDYKVN